MHVKRIALVPMSAKPYTAGHDHLIRTAASECSEVHVYTSLGNRARPGEIPILGDDMKRIWSEHIAPILPRNVTIHFVVQPVKSTWKALEAWDGTSKMVLYGDPDDMVMNFPDERLNKYAAQAHEAQMIMRRPVSRTEMPVSGTAVRNSIANDDFQTFESFMPAGINAEAIWDILRGSMNTIVKKTAKARTKKA